MFGDITVPFGLIQEIILHNTLELYNDWAVHDFMVHKYANRKKRWIMHDPQNEEIIEGLLGTYTECVFPLSFFL